MVTLTERAQPAVSELLESDENQLYEELGLRIQAMSNDERTAGTFAPDVTYDAAVQGPLDVLRDIGTRFFEKFNREAYDLVCGTDAEDSEQRRKLISGLSVSAGTAAAALAALLVTNLAMAPAVAAVVAAIIMKLFFRPAYEALCETWSERLPQPAG